MSLEPCDKHEMSNCSYCTGAEARFAASLEEPTYDRGAPPRIPGGVTIFSRFSGTCAGCGRRYDVNDAIHRDNEVWDGWVGVACCIQGTVGERDRGVLR